MGLQCSGEVLDNCFHFMVEDGFINNLANREHFRIKYWGRFKDDILVVLKGRQSNADIDRFMGYLSHRSRFFKLKLDSVSAYSVSMLDVQFFKGGRWQHTFF